MKVVERLESNRRKAIVECPQCLTQSEGDYYKHSKAPESLCQTCMLTNRNKSNTMRSAQQIEVDKDVLQKNKPTNGLYIIKFTDRRQKCIVKCKHCTIEYERLYKPNIYEQYGCTDCTKSSRLGSTIKGREISHNHRLSRIFGNMVQRTTNPKDSGYQWYGAKGIKICQEWLKDINVFYVWALANGYKDNLSIDRQDGNKGYSPDNCRWVTAEVQSRNTRLLRVDNMTGYRGVSPAHDGIRFRARITVNYKQIELGTYTTAVEAAYAYDNYVIRNSLEHTQNFSGK